MSSDQERDDVDVAHESPPESTPTSASSAQDRPSPTSPRAAKPHMSGHGPLPKPNFDFSKSVPSTSDSRDSPLSPAAADRVFPIRSVVSVDPTPTPSHRSERAYEGYFQNASHAKEHARKISQGRTRTSSRESTLVRNRQTSAEAQRSPRPHIDAGHRSRQASVSTIDTGESQTPITPSQERQPPPLLFNDIVNDNGSDRGSTAPSDRPKSLRSMSVRSTDETGPLVTARFKHVVQDGGHAIITGRDGDTLQRCEDEPIHIPGAVQSFGLLVALEEQSEGRLVVRVVSENSKRMIGYTPKQLFAMESFTDILSEEQADNLLDHVDFIRDEDSDVMTNGPEVFTMSVRTPHRKNVKLWCAMHINDAHKDLVICEFELEDDPVNPLVPVSEQTPEPPEDTLSSQPTQEEYLESTQNTSKPLRVLRSARKRKGEAAAMEVFNIMSQVQEQLAAAPSLEKFLKILVGVVKELTGFHRVMVYQFDQAWNGRVVTELIDPRATKDLYKGLNFPASDIPKQARELYKVNKVRMLYDRDQETARLVCRTVEDLEQPLDLTYSYLRAMSPIHIKYLGNMAVRSSMSISINAFDELWGLIACHSYGSKGMRVSFPIRKMCRLVGDSASRNIERLSYASRLQARKLINTVPTQKNPSGYIIASSEDLLKLFDADFGLLSIRDETKILGHLEQSQEALAMLEYLRMRSVTNVMTSMDIHEDFPDLRYAPGFQVIAGLLIVPLSSSGHDFIVFFRKGQLKEVKWAGNPYEKFIKEGTEGYLEPRKSFRTWSETVVGKCREWTEEEIETAAVLCLVYGKFIEVWRQKEAALQNSQLTRLLLANSAHEVRTPLNAIINYLEIALEGSLDQETRDNLAKSHSASKSLIYVINDLLDLTKTEEGGDLTKDEVFELKSTLTEATDMFRGDAKRKNISYEVINHPGLPGQVVGDQRRVRQAISNVTANAIQNTTEGGVKVEMYVAGVADDHVDVEVSVADTGVGMNGKKLDALFRELEQVQSEPDSGLNDAVLSDPKALPESAEKDGKRNLGLGLALVARIIRNMNGQLRLKSEEGKGTRFVIQFPFDLPEGEPKQLSIESRSVTGSITPHAEAPGTPVTPPVAGEMTLIERGSATRRDSYDSNRRPRPGGHVSRKNSGDSMASRRSVGSMKSAHSNMSRMSAASGRSEAERLIDMMQEPYLVDGPTRSGNRHSYGAPGAQDRPRLEKRHTHTGVDEVGSPVKSRAKSFETAPVPRSEPPAHIPGESNVMDQGQPIRPVKMPEEALLSPTAPTGTRAALSAPAAQVPHSVHDQLPEKSDDPPTADHMRVLVAEDDPVNSRIIKKRLEKLGHEICLTVNGEECSSTYGDKSGFFDIILMDMQMPIVDGLTSAKMIRSFEKSHPTHLLSTRAALNGRVPIIAVSASLEEKLRQTYIDAGFDGWILKPIDFRRLSTILQGIVDQDCRKENLYAKGKWEGGGWFVGAQPEVWEADTRPSQELPTKAMVDPEAVEEAAEDEDPAVKEEGESVQSLEQRRLLEKQEAENEDAGEKEGAGGDGEEVEEGESAKATSMPELGSKRFRRSSGEQQQQESVGVTEEGVRHASPSPMDEADGDGGGDEGT